MNSAAPTCLRPEDWQLFVCNTPDCGQVLAHVGKQGDVYPKIAGVWADKEGRLFIRCPRCGRDKQLPIRRRAA